MKDFLGGVLESAVGGWKKDLRKEVSGLEGGALGAAGDDVQSFLLKKLAGGDKLLFRGAADLQADVGDHHGFRVGEGGAFSVHGPGTGGAYSVEFVLEQTEA